MPSLNGPEPATPEGQAYYHGGGIEADQRRYYEQQQIESGSKKPVVQIDRLGNIVAIDSAFRVENNAPLDLPSEELASWKASHGGSASFFQWTRDTYGCPTDPLGWNTYVKNVQQQPGGIFGNVQIEPEVEYITVQTVGMPANYDVTNPHQIMIPNDKGVFVAVDCRTWDGSTPKSSDPFEPSPVAKTLPKVGEPVSQLVQSTTLVQPVKLEESLISLLANLLKKLLKGRTG